ncbi:MAG: histidinol-phosphate transaminase [bacterium]|nr:histidinol-phosphate transaminase [bacterium]
MIDQLVRKNIRDMKPYSSARSLHQSGMFFDANENALGSTVTLEGVPELNRYPDPYSKKLRSALAKFLGIGDENIFAGNGSDEIIDLLIRLFVNPDESVLVVEPTYGMYKVAAETAGVGVETCSLNDNFQIDIPSVFNSTTPQTKLIFCCSPNNPTGNLLRAEDIKELCKKFKGIVVVDEAYIEFASKESLSKRVADFENLVILRTFSKIWGLAGIRVGYAIANEKVIQYLDKIKAPYNINRISSALAVRALAEKETVAEFKDTILKERNRMNKRLTEMGLTVFPSDANFLLVKYPTASNIAKKLAGESALIIREFGNKKLLENCVRISIATPEQNDVLLTAIKKLI